MEERLLYFEKYHESLLKFNLERDKEILELIEMTEDFFGPRSLAEFLPKWAARRSEWLGRVVILPDYIEGIFISKKIEILFYFNIYSIFL